MPGDGLTTWTDNTGSLAPVSTFKLDTLGLPALVGTQSGTVDILAGADPASAIVVINDAALRAGDDGSGHHFSCPIPVGAAQTAPWWGMHIVLVDTIVGPHYHNGWDGLGMSLIGGIVDLLAGRTGVPPVGGSGSLYGVINGPHISSGEWGIGAGGIGGPETDDAHFYISRS